MEISSPTVAPMTVVGSVSQCPKELSRALGVSEHSMSSTLEPTWQGSPTGLFTWGFLLFLSNFDFIWRVSLRKAFCSSRGRQCCTMRLVKVSFGILP